MRRRVTLLYLLAALAGIAGAARVQPELLRLRRAFRLTQADPLENMPPMVAFTTVALGGFRGLLVDALWMRATRLQDEGKYFELVQLAGWITKLQPRFASIWAFHAWNLAYNVSVMLPAPEDRWRWVRHGITLLRDDGLRYNPGSAQLYRELSWLYQHKLGQDMDQAHFFYKRAWAEEMTRALGGERPDFDRLAAAPTDLEVLRATPGVPELLSALDAAGFAPPYDRLLDADPPPETIASRPADDPAVRALLDFLRARRARQTYRLDPDAMKAVDEAYGPLDWRLPDAHAIYWARQGIPYARSRFDRIQLERSIFQSMANAFLRGRMIDNRELGYFALTPNLALYSRVRQAYLDALAEFPNDDSIQVAFRNFLSDAATIFYTYNLESRAREIYAELAERFPEVAAADGFEAYLYKQWQEYGQDFSPGQASAFVESALYQSHFWRALGDRDRAAGFARMAQLAWQRYMDIRQDPEFRARTGLPPLEEMDRIARERVREFVDQARAAAAEARAGENPPSP